MQFNMEGAINNNNLALEQTKIAQGVTSIDYLVLKEDQLIKG